MTDSKVDQSIRAHWERTQAERLALLERLVSINSFCDNLAGIDEQRAVLRPEFEALGFDVEEPLLRPEGSPRPRAAHLVAVRPAPSRPRLLLIAHLDTVFPPGDGEGCLRREGDLLHGPGVGDIKGGVVTILSAVAALDAAGLGDTLDLTVVMNSDEEVGSHTSRGLIRELATGCRWALGFEPAFHPPEESVAKHEHIQHVVARKGCGRFCFELDGVAAHSGGAHQLGVSAIEALATKILGVHALTDRPSGVTTNVGLISGGRSVNTVAPNASAEIDFRFSTNEDGERVASQIQELLCREERVNEEMQRAVTCRLEEGGGVLWPTLEPTEDSMALSELVCRVSSRLGFSAVAISRGGASDAANAAAVGVPAICGLGPVTFGIHTDAEHTSVPALSAAVRVAAGVLAELGQS